MEWTDEKMQEKGKIESPGVLTNNASALNSYTKEVVIGVKENEGNKLLRDSLHSPPSNLREKDEAERPKKSDGPSYLPPIMGLCAPNAPQQNSTKRNSSRAHGRITKKGNKSNFPLNTPGFSGSTTKDLKSSLSDKPLPFPLHRPPLVKRKFSDSLECSSASSADPLGKTCFPKPPFDDRVLLNYPPKTFSSPGPDVPNVHPPSSMPSIPDLNLPVQNISYFNQEFQGKPNTSPPFPEIHRNILENITSRTGLGAGSLFRGMPKVDGWSEDEIYSLWLGVRRYGIDNWDAILRDPRLKFPNFKYPNELASKWEEELLNAYSPTRSGGPISKNCTNHAGILAENHDPFRTVGSGNFPASVFGNLSSQSSDIHGSHNSGFLPLNQPSGCEIQLEDEIYRRNHQKVSSQMNHAHAFSHGFPPASSFLPDLNDTPYLSSLKGKEIATEDSSLKETLQHWYLGAVGTPETRDHESPSIVSVRRESVRTTNSQFVTPSPPPLQPKDSRKSMNMIGPSPTDIAGSTQDGHGGSSSSSFTSKSISMLPSMLNQMPRK